MGGSNSGTGGSSTPTGGGGDGGWRGGGSTGAGSSTGNSYDFEAIVVAASNAPGETWRGGV